MADVTCRVFGLFDMYGHTDYLGEKVTQTQHAVQCAMSAEKEGADVPTILGALFHDIGHLIGQEKKSLRMVTGETILGVQAHDEVGEEFLQSLGIPEEVSDFARGHVQAKRYHTYKDPDYYGRLTEASKMTLVHQGGPMSAHEAREFEQHPRFQQILEMRTWDEKAKVEHMKMEPLDKYRTMFQQYMEKRC